MANKALIVVDVVIDNTPIGKFQTSGDFEVEVATIVDIPAALEQPVVHTGKQTVAPIELTRIDTGGTISHQWLISKLKTVASCTRTGYDEDKNPSPGKSTVWTGKYTKLTLSGADSNADDALDKFSITITNATVA